ncbi:hypothetical protein [Mumia sp. DW29H23]|uniref:hypothetical protein n=1 Tax=Mumia sp. DW29H23 TaxID=3421241 RepID=UPI003D69B424
MALAAGAGCADTVTPTAADTTPPQVRLEIWNLPPQGGSTSTEQPSAWVNAMPTSVEVRIGGRYEVAVRVEDPESGVAAVRVDRDNGFTSCSPSGRAPNISAPDRFRTESSGRTFYPPGTPTPTAHPAFRLVSLDVTITSVSQGCLLGDSITQAPATIRLSEAVNGAGLRARITGTTDPAGPNGWLGLTFLKVP